MTPPELDIIVPVHDAARPVHRLAASVLETTRTRIRLTFVCHGIAAERVRAALGALADDPRVRLIEFSDGVRSPAGPFIAGLEQATAEFVMKIDSDDTLEHGAVDAWMAVRARTGAEIVICRMRAVGADRDWTTPPARPGRRSRLDAVRDRLSYRTSTMGVISRERMLRALPVVGLPTGEDIESSLRLWFSGASIALADREPAYLVHNDGTDRSTDRRPVDEEFAWLDRLREGDWMAGLTEDQRSAIATKLLRVQLCGAVSARAAEITDDDLAAMRTRAAQLIELGGGVPPWLARADRDLIDAVLSHGSTSAELTALAARRRRFGHPMTLLPRALRWTLHREAPLRAMFAFAIAGRRRTRR